MSTRDLNEDQRWQVADRLDEIPSACWADLVSWALKGSTAVEDEFGEVVDSPIPDTSSGAWCALDVAGNKHGICYCGKFAAGLEVSDGR